MKTLPKGQMNTWLTVDPKTCTHNGDFHDSICSECGYECKDHKWESGECIHCGGECDHDEIEDGYCLECGEGFWDIQDTDALYDTWKDREF